MAKRAGGTPKITDEIRKVAELKDDPKNARRHTSAQIADISASIERFGYVNKIVIRPNGRIIGGHATRDALTLLHREDAECRVVAGLTEAGYRALGLALNKLPENSSWDDDVLREVFAELQGAGDDVSALGFSSKEVEDLLSEPETLEVKEVETTQIDDEFWISVRGPLASQADALLALERAMKPFAGVSVDLGTIAIG